MITHNFPYVFFYVVVSFILFFVFFERCFHFDCFSPSEIILICLIYIYIHPFIRSLVSYMPKNYFYFSLSLISLALFYSFKFNCSMMKNEETTKEWDERNSRASYSTIIVKDIIIIIIVNLHFILVLLLLQQSSTHISIEN